ncbi:hypothetical protein Tco_1095136 [Tanacetum coccineum]
MKRNYLAVHHSKEKKRDKYLFDAKDAWQFHYDGIYGTLVAPSDYNGIATWVIGSDSIRVSMSPSLLVGHLKLSSPAKDNTRITDKKVTVDWN